MNTESAFKIICLSSEMGLENQVITYLDTLFIFFDLCESSD